MALAKIKYSFILIFLVWMSYAFYIFFNSNRPNSITNELAFAKNQLKILQKQNVELVTIMNNWKKFKSKSGAHNEEDKHNFKENSIYKLPSLREYVRSGPESRARDLAQMPAVISDRHRRRSALGLWHVSKYLESHFADLLDKGLLDRALNRPSNASGRAAGDAGQDLRARLIHMQNYTRDAIYDIASHLKIMKSVSDRQWKSQLNAQLSGIVTKRILQIQNPANCSTARKLVCDMGKACGFGCQIHHTVYCFIVAYATGRVLVVKSKSWTYDPLGFEHDFLPISTTCKGDAGSSHGTWSGDESALGVEPQVLTLPIIDVMSPKSLFLPQAIPSDLGPLIAVAHGRPHVWWVGQFVSFLLRPQPALKAKIEGLVKSGQIPFQHPIVGIHVRRTDKIGTEAALHEIDEYMKHVEDWFRIYEISHLYAPDSTQPHTRNAQGAVKRRVYVATDDVAVLAETKKKYPNYVVLGNLEAANSAGTSSRYSQGGLTGIYLDVYFLSRCNYLVCTFSSQVCRLAFELMNGHDMADPADSYYSLDDMYYYGGGNGLRYRAVRDHYVPLYPSDQRPIQPHEAGLRVGEVVSLAGDENDGFSAGKKEGGSQGKEMFPSYLLEELPTLVDQFGKSYDVADIQDGGGVAYGDEVSTNPVVDAYDVDI